MTYKTENQVKRFKGYSCLCYYVGTILTNDGKDKWHCWATLDGSFTAYWRCEPIKGQNTYKRTQFWYDPAHSLRPQKP